MRLSFSMLLAAAVVAAAAGAIVVAGPGAFDDLVVWIYTQQRAFHRALTQDLRSLAAGGGTAAAAALIGASFLYGVFHAAGPGHGKAVLTTYLLTRPGRRARGVGLAVAAALCQGLTAIVLVYGLVVLAGWLPRETAVAATWAERASYLLVMAVGALLAVHAAPRLASAAAGVFARRPAVAGHPHDHDHHDGCGCGHAHGPSAAEIAGTTSARAALGVVLSIGLRPCTGAVLVLVFAEAAGIGPAGIAAVVAMAAGTALAIATLAFLAVHARRWADALVGTRFPALGLVGGAVSIAGGVLVFAIGLSLLAASFAPQHPLGLG